MTAYVIERNGLYFSSTYGWTTDLDNADLFRYEEHMCLKPHIGGQWVCIER